MLSIEDYDRVRAHRAGSCSSPGTKTPRRAGERIIEAERGYAVIEKTGTAGAEAARLHPRETDTT